MNRTLKQIFLSAAAVALIASSSPNVSYAQVPQTPIIETDGEFFREIMICQALYKACLSRITLGDEICGAFWEFVTLTGSEGCYQACKNEAKRCADQARISWEMHKKLKPGEQRKPVGPTPEELQPGTWGVW